MNPNFDEFGWYYSIDGEQFHGPYDTREDAIAMGRDHAEGTPFEICEANSETPRFTVSGEYVLESFEDENASIAGDSESILSPTREQVTDLTNRLTATFAEWAKGVRTHVWAFGEIRNKELIKAEGEPA